MIRLREEVKVSLVQAACAGDCDATPCEMRWDGPSSILCAVRSRRHGILVRQSGPWRALSFGDPRTAQVQTLVDVNDPARPCRFSTRSLLTAAAMHAAPERILCLGLGGGNLVLALLELFPRSCIDVVEVDAVIVGLARTWFGVDSGPRLRIHVQDGREFVRQAIAAGLRWDVVLQDCLDNHYVPAHMMTLQFLRELRRALRGSGIVACTSLAVGELRDRELATCAAVFEDRLVLASEIQQVDIGFAGRLPATAFSSLVAHAQPLARLGLDAWAACHHIGTAQFPPAHVRAVVDENCRSSALNALRCAAQPTWMHARRALCRHRPSLESCGDH